MNILKFDHKKGIIKARIKNYDDIIILNLIIEKGDQITAITRRKININGHIDIRKIKIKLSVESTEIKENALDVSGVIVYSSDEMVPHKHHTIKLKVGSVFLLIKKELLNFQIDLLKKSANKTKIVIICVYEIGYAIFYKMTDVSLKKLFEIKGDVSGKMFKNESRKDFINELEKNIKEEYNKEEFDLFLVAGDNLTNQILKKDLAGINISFETVSYAHTGLNELIKKDVINKLLLNAQVVKQKEIINEFIEQISKNNPKYLYGIEQIKKATEDGSVEAAVISKNFVIKNKEIVKRMDESGVDIFMAYQNDESLDMLDNFGGAIIKLY